MDSREFTGWMAFAKFEPFGCQAEWERTASIMLKIIEVNATKETEVPSLSDLMPDFGSKRELSEAQIAAKVQAHMAMARKGGRVDGC